MVDKLEGMLRATDVTGGLLRVHADDGKKYLCKTVGVGSIGKGNRYKIPKITDEQKDDLIRKTLLELEIKGRSADIVKEDCSVTTKFLHTMARELSPYAEYTVKFYQIVEDLGEVNG